MSSLITQDFFKLIDKRLDGKKLFRLQPAVVIEGGKAPLIGFDMMNAIPYQALIVPERLTDHTITVIVDDVEKDVTVKNNLKTGEHVILLQDLGGQTFYVLDRQFSIADSVSDTESEQNDGLTS